ncbi:unnamed protein product [Brassicogethes aeneus]|uniref:TOG domain-containing protein n=1 Tax=Brassicogethes aeneus TaxID=1431903 RepID=A0A9P0FGU2_BRAAE|nr:unnamed protein product [Brassicogethes aeneus]
MAEVELSHVLKDLPYKVQTASLKERKEVIGNVINVLSSPDIGENVVKGICRLLHLTLFRYRDSFSQVLVRNLIQVLLEKHSSVSVKCLTAVLEDISSQLKNIVATQSTCQTAQYALQWSTIVFSVGWKHNSAAVQNELKRIVEIQSILLMAVHSAGNGKRSSKAQTLLSNSWSSVPESEKMYLEQLKNVEQNQTVCIMASAIIKRLSFIGNKPVFESYMEYFLDTLIKNLISCKTRPSENIIKSCYPLLEQMNNDQFKTLLLPAIQKSMLRNPEVILKCVGLIITGCKIDMSPYALDIGNSLIANLHSKDDKARKESADSLKCLAEKIKESKAIENLLDKVFKVFNGSDGKLTVAEHKISVLEGAGNLSYNNVPNPQLQNLIAIASDSFIKVLEIEVHEKTLCSTLTMLTLWTLKLTNEVPKKILDGLKNGMNLKTSTPMVKTAYVECVLSTLTSNTIAQAKIFAPTLMKSLEKAVSQPTQSAIVTEGLSAALLLLAMAHAQVDVEGGYGALWNAALDMDKQIFVSEKFLSSATSEALVLVMRLGEKLLVNHPDKVKDAKFQPLYKAILHCVTLQDSQTRRKNLLILKRMVNGLAGPAISKILFTELHQQLSLTKEGNDASNEISSHALIECIVTLCSASGLSREHLKTLALHSLLPAHHPKAVAFASNLWVKILKHHKVKPKDLLGELEDEIRSIFIDNYRVLPMKENAVATLAEINPDIILPRIVSKVTTDLDNSAFRQISKDDYFTFLTPEGELYDKSVVPGDDSNAANNLKRESKAYSYKEQLEELQLRRELEEKRKKEGKVKPPQFTPKQLEAIKNQKVKEQGIRDRLTQLNTILMNCVSLVRAAAKGNPTRLSLHFKELLPSILVNLQSPLAAPSLTKLFADLRHTVFPTEVDPLAELISFVTLRLYKPQCDLDVNWEEENLNKAMMRTLKLIQEKTVPKKLDEVSDAECFTVPAFTYSFPMIKSSLLSNYARNHDDVIHDGLQIINEHAKLRGTDNGNKDVRHPQYLPTEQMFTLLVDIINSTSGRAQSQCEACLLEVASCVSGNEGCAKVTIKEIDVLLTALQSPSAVVRDAALRCLVIVSSALPTYETDYQYALKVNKRIWIAKFDENEENRQLAEKLWNEAELTFSPTLSGELLSDIEHPVECVQSAASQALANLLESDLDQVEATLKKLLELYNSRLKMIPARMDEFGREVEKAIDTWFPRRGVALSLAQLAPLVTPDLIGDLVQFFVFTSLGDRNETVRKEMLNAALRIVDLHGKDTVGTLWPVFDDFMGKSSKSAHYDAVKQAVVILMGSLARHLDKDDVRIKPIVMRLIQALSTPSQTVQESVANCLPPLVSAVKEESSGLVNKLLHQLLKGDKYGERKGAAYGLAGLVKGMGILALKQNDIMTKLTEAIQDKKNYKHREGALFAFEMLFQMLGKLFEPYIVHVLPHLLQCFGDSSQHVRTAADDTAKVVMSKLSGHGVKLVLPSLLEALNGDSWRTKTGSVELLGAMAYCAPKQLSSCLPSIVPKLIEVLSDSHMKVQEAGAAALKVIGSVIRNPEIQAIVPTLLKALQDPSNKTSVCLQTLLDTQFVHFIDAPSLALIMPVVQRAFLDRSTETRKMAAQIIGNMYSLTDQKDLMPYLPTIIPGLKTSLLDPVPEVRSVSARALGAMVRGMGESSFEDLLPWLMQTLTSESSLSEVVGGLGVEKLHKLMPDIISTAERTDIAPHVKDGYIMMFIYMPVVFTSDFTPYIGQIITPILKALADENEYVRDTALKAGQRIVTLYADSAILLLLPELEKGLFDDNWRIRYSSVQLLGDLLYRISGVTGKMSTETASEDDNFGTEQSHQAIIRSLGAERRNRVLAGLYMGRSDVALMVRQAALHVWKVVVTNTPRTLREILPTLFGLLLGCLASESYDKRQVAARTLGDLVRKLGERVLPEIIPILERGLQSDRADQRQGVCIGLSEIMTSTSRDMVLTFVNSLVPTVRKALCDPLPEVRKAAAKTFDSLHSTVGARALDDILPSLLNQLNDEDAAVVECTLDGLRQVMAIKSRVVLPYLVPQLTAPPANTKALSILASVAGEALNKYLPKILPALQASLASSRGTPEETEQLDYCQAVVLSVMDEAGVRTVIDTMLENTRVENDDQRRAAATLLCGFCANSKAQYLDHIPQLLRGLIYLCTDKDTDVLKMSWEALTAIVKGLEPKQQSTYVSDVRQAVRYAVSDIKDGGALLPGFCLPKGITPVLPIFREALLNGDGDEKEAAALGLGEIIKVTSASALQTSVVAITGPLIRILGDRFSANVKTAVLDTLAILLAKVGIMCKQFLPQLQTTFIKALNDPNRVVRLKSGAALSHLIVIHQRADPLFTELHNTVKNSEDIAIKETTLHALRGIITPAGDKMSEPVKKQIYTTLLTFLNHSEDNVRKCAAGCLGAICKYLPPDQLDPTFSEHILNDDASLNNSLREGRGAALTVVIKECPDLVWDEQYRKKLLQTLLGQISSTTINITKIGIRSSGYLLQFLMLKKEPLPASLLGPFVRTMNNSNNEVKQLLARVCNHLAKVIPPDHMSPDLLKLLLPTLVNGTKEKNSYVKANSEIALIAVLKLKEGDAICQSYLNILDAGAKESLSDVVSKVLKKILTQSEGKEEELDDTLLT